MMEEPVCKLADEPADVSDDRLLFYWRGYPNIYSLSPQKFTGGLAYFGLYFPYIVLIFGG